MREIIKKIVPKPLTRIYKKSRHDVIVMLFYAFRILPINKQKVVLMNIWGYGDNTKYISEALAKVHVPAKFNKPMKLIYVTNHPSTADAPKCIKILKTNSLSAIYALSTARIWVETNRKEGYIRKRKGQYYIQTWHGGLPLKKIEGDCGELLGEEYIKRAKWDSSITDLYISNGSFCTSMYQRAFWYKGKILEYGMPRNDILFSKSNTRIQKTRDMMGIKDGIKIAVYAPTYRESGSTKAYLKNIETLQNLLSTHYKECYAVIIRLHPLCSSDNTIYEYNEHIINGSKSHDMYELLEASDILITDYSNTMFEAAMIKKPVFLYAEDITEYEKTRGLYFNPFDLPFLIARNEEELWNNIKNFNYETYTKKSEVFLKKTGIKETGNASRKTAEYIHNLISQ